MKRQWTRRRAPDHDHSDRCNKPKRLVDLESGDCRWPLGDPREPDFRFCAALQLLGYPCCEHHWRIAFNPAKLRIQPPPDVPSRSATAV
jgi:GcrA cell cycle regulator